MLKRSLPDWLKVKLPTTDTFLKVENTIKQHNLCTVCVEAKCPNRAECFDKGTSTFLIMGDTCTRNCRYCNIASGKPRKLDENEPKKIAKAVKKLGLSYAVITSVTRDDLSDQGAEHFADTILEIKSLNPNTKVEVLTPDFRGNVELLKKVLSSMPYAFNHNIEVAKSLFPFVRPQGSYARSLKMLYAAKEIAPLVISKSGFMVGLGETKENILETLDNLRKAKVEFVTIGQYLRPNKELVPVKKFYTPDEFREFRQYGLKIGFKQVFAGPLVRSSYKAAEMLS